MKSLYAIIFYFFSASLPAQDLQREINDQVWKPLIQSFNDYNTDGFMALHSKDVIKDVGRSARDGKSVWNWNDYYEQQQKWDQREKKSNMKRTVELRFTKRIGQEQLAVEVGIYKTTTTNQGGESQVFYGRFHVVHRKENGIWKILVDTDSTEGNAISEKDFLSANLME